MRVAVCALQVCNLDECGDAIPSPFQGASQPGYSMATGIARGRSLHLSGLASARKAAYSEHLGASMSRMQELWAAIGEAHSRLVTKGGSGGQQAEAAVCSWLHAAERGELQSCRTPQPRSWLRYLIFTVHVHIVRQRDSSEALLYDVL
jgi:hypothetical protein